MFIPLSLIVAPALEATLPSLSLKSVNAFRHSDESKNSREVFSLDQNWKFHLGNATDPSKDFNYGTGNMYAKTGNASGPFSVGYPESDWRTVSLPHDWATELPFEKTNDYTLIAHGSKPLGLQYPASSIGWYRRTFTIPTSEEGRHIIVRFDGVFKDAEVFYNGIRLGEHLGGYEPFSYDLAPLTHYGEPNALVVRVNASQNSGWFYEGAGIYRHVWLICSNLIHVAQNGVEVVANLSKDFNTADVVVHTSVTNSSDKPEVVQVKNAVIEPNPDIRNYISSYMPPEPTEYTTIPAGATSLFTNQIPMVKPRLWEMSDPHMYQMVTQVSVQKGNQWIPVDSHLDSFGIRSIHFDANKGFFLNGKHVQIKGACDHQDHAGVGIAVPDSLNEYRIQQLKKYGFNALRTSHNMPTKSVIQACDKLGVLVMDETRVFSTSPEALSDLASLVKRDRNDPCVIMWSIGNEEPLEPTLEGARIAKVMMKTVHQFDKTRPCSMASDHGNAYLGANSVLDLRGWNYVHNPSTDAYHKAHPLQPMFGSEEASTLSTRGEYVNDPQKGYMSAYDENNPGWGATAETWINYYATRPYLAGAFVWTGFDYRGEPTPYGWPCISSHFGILDTCGFPKDIAYYYVASWTTKPMVHIAPNWTLSAKEGTPIRVWIETNCDEVQLSLNGKLLGSQKATPLKHLEWQVPYEAGKLEAIGYRNGKPVCHDDEVTAGAVAKYVITPSSESAPADGSSTVEFNIKAEDALGNFVPNAGDRLKFGLEGGLGSILGVGNGDPSSHEPDTFISLPTSLKIPNWTMSPVGNNVTPSADYTATSLVSTEVEGSGDQIQEPNTSAVFQASFDLDENQVKELNRLNIGHIDDIGTIFVNGVQVGTTHQWNAGFSFPLKGVLKAGSNKIVVWVNNQGGSGGLGQGVSLSGIGKPAVFTRSLFNGLAQVIVKTGTLPGDLVFTVEGPQGIRTTSKVKLNQAPVIPSLP